jgi:sec-independent protein translocase protein TatC
MFYLKEIFLRFKYSCLTVFFILLICYKYKSILFLIVLLSILDYKDSPTITFDHFIYTHPTELFQTFICLTLFLTFLFVLPYLCWQVLDFIKSSLHLFEYNFLKTILKFFGLFCFSLNLLGFFVLFPKVWFWFLEFNASTNDLNPGLNFFFELKVLDYFSFLFDFLYFLNFALLVISVLFMLLTRLGLKNLVNWKKLFIFSNIVFATLLSPPDILTQIVLLLLFTLLLELFICLLIFQFKIKNFLKR